MRDVTSPVCMRRMCYALILRGRVCWDTICLCFYVRVLRYESSPTGLGTDSRAWPCGSGTDSRLWSYGFGTDSQLWPCTGLVLTVGYDPT
eukprot:1708754-Rhodomonas_salina.2